MALFEERCSGADPQLEKLLSDIGMPRPFALRVMEAARKELPGGEDCDGVNELAGQLLAAVKNRENGPWKELPEEIYIDTMKCFSRFVEEHCRSEGRYGFDRGFWTPRQVEARLFRIGQLEYELREAQGERLLDLHIPTDARLDMALLDDSVARARSFLREYFPAWAEAPMECGSWLLSPALPELLPANARILQFQRPFRLSKVNWEAMDVLRWVFNLTPRQQETTPLSQLPENTSLQRSMKARLCAGGKVGVARGRLTAPFSGQ